MRKMFVIFQYGRFPPTHTLRQITIILGEKEEFTASLCCFLEISLEQRDEQLKQKDEQLKILFERVTRLEKMIEKCV